MYTRESNNTDCELCMIYSLHTHNLSLSLLDSHKESAEITLARAVAAAAEKSIFHTAQSCFGSTHSDEMWRKRHY